MLSTKELLLLIAIIAITTFMTRALPFLIFPEGKKIPVIIEYLGNVLPYAIIGMLVVYALKDTTFLSYPYGLPELIAIVLVVVVHKWRHNLLLSIAGGTVFYMFLVQAVFV